MSSLPPRPQFPAPTRALLQRLFGEAPEASLSSLRAAHARAGLGADAQRTLQGLHLAGAVRPVPDAPGRFARCDQPPLCRIAASPARQDREVDLQAVLAAMRARRLRSGALLRPQDFPGEDGAAVIALLLRRRWAARTRECRVILTPEGHRAMWAPATSLDAGEARWHGVHRFRMQSSASLAHR